VSESWDEVEVIDDESFDDGSSGEVEVGEMSNVDVRRISGGWIERDEDGEGWPGEESEVGAFEEGHRDGSEGREG